MSISSDRRAVALYAILSRDIGDFLDLITEEEDVEALKTLYLMLATPNKEMSASDRKWNELGAPIVEGNLKKRGVPVPVVKMPQDPHLCEHPKEVPGLCPCPPDCFCRGKSCDPVEAKAVELPPLSRVDRLLSDDDCPCL